VRRQHGGDSLEDRQVNRKRTEVPAVHADDRRTARERSIQFGLVVDLNERGETECPRLTQQVLQLDVVERAGNQKHCIRSRLRSFDKLVRSDYEVFPQQRNVNGLPDGVKMLERAVEERRFGQHRDRGGPGVRVGLRVRRRVVVLSQDAFRR
jgi:hypothetical protein